MNSKTSIIVLDDDPVVSRLISKATKLQTYSFISEEKLLPSIKNMNPKAVFVDIHLGYTDRTGLDIIPLLRAEWPYAAIIVITSNSFPGTLREAFQAGANDFIEKPIKVSELIPRLEIRMEEQREMKAAAQSDVGNMTLNRMQKILNVNGMKNYLSTLETNLLHMLIRFHGITVSKKALLRKGWPGIAVSENALEKKMSEIRGILREVGANVSVETVYGKGYRLSKNRH